jgi:hypothetical protein
VSETYAKLFSSILRSSIWTEPLETKIVWITMLALADRHGYVGASIPGIASAAGVPLDKAAEAIAKFLAPDEWSRSKDFDVAGGGRRGHRAGTPGRRCAPHRRASGNTNCGDAVWKSRPQSAQVPVHRPNSVTTPSRRT